MDFKKRLGDAVSRGEKRRREAVDQAARQAMSDQDYARLHQRFRTALADRIESNLRAVADQFPGFQFETIIDDRGWGAGLRRDDLLLESDRRRNNYYSRLELVVRPFSSYHVLDLAGKATIRNKELFNRSHYRPLAEASEEAFAELVDAWSIEFAEVYASWS